MHKKLEAACTARRFYGNIFLLLQVLDPFVNCTSIIAEILAFYDYAGDDC